MFYHIQILAKKGPLGTIWIAAHHDKRLKRSQVFETNVGETIDAIVTPEVPLGQAVEEGLRADQQAKKREEQICVKVSSKCRGAVNSYRTPSDL